PQGEFRENVDRLGYGISGHLAYQPNPFFAVGGALGVITYGNQVRHEPFSYTIPDVMVKVTTTNSFMFGHILMQIGIPMGYVRPYAEGRFGFNYLWTETKIEDIDDEENEIASSTNFSDATFCYGFGGGLMIKVYETPKKKKSKQDSDVSKLYVDLKAIYSYGGEAEYLKEGSIECGAEGQVTYDVSKSKTDLLTVNVGVAFEF
ncbi:hypothetical protein DRQ33_06725, partial [bacterium]